MANRTKLLHLTLSQTTNLDSSKLKEFADDNFKFDENGSKLLKRVENTVGKGEIAGYVIARVFKRLLLLKNFENK